MQRFDYANVSYSPGHEVIRCVSLHLPGPLRSSSLDIVCGYPASHGRSCRLFAFSVLAYCMQVLCKACSAAESVACSVLWVLALFWPRLWLSMLASDAMRWWCGVRGITCEKWVKTDTFNRRGQTGTVNVSFFFPVNQWQIGRQDYHRLLKEVLVEGELDDGETFNAIFVRPV